MTSTTPDESQPSFQSQVRLWDDPRNTPDLLAREAFAEKISHALSNWKKDESLVVALFGDWGTGKTWLLHQVRAQLEKNKSFTVCDFSPWQFESNEQITFEFFTAIFDVLPKDDCPNNQKRAKLWATLGAMVSVAKIGTTVASVTNPAIPAIAVANPILGGIEQLLEKGKHAAEGANQNFLKGLFGKRNSTAFQKADATLSEIRESLLELFKEEDAPKILVTIDDLDRLPDEQIQMIFRLLKTTVNFPNLHFLVLGERHQLAKALDPVAHNEGDRYMEKIVQVPVYMPEIDSIFLKNRMQEGLELIAHTYGYANTSERLTGRGDELWNDFLKIKLTNLRAIYRLLTVVEFKCSALSNHGKLEVDLLDLLSIEYLRLYAPTTYDKVLSEIFPLTNGFRRSPRTLNKETDDNTDALAILSDSELGKKGAYQACSHLFPRFPEAVSTWSSEHMSTSESNSKITLLSSERPICDSSYQPLYFKLSLDEKILSRSSYEMVLNETDQTKLEGQLLGLGSETRRLLFQHMLAEETFAKKVQAPEVWLRVLANLSDSMEDNSGVFHISECRYAYQVWLKLFDDIPAGQPQVTFIEAIYKQTNSVTILALLLEDLRDTADFRFSKHAVDKRESLPRLEKEQLNILSDRLLAITVKACRENTFPITNRGGGRLYRLVYAIGPERFEEILQDTEAIDFQSVMIIVEAIAIAIMPRYHTSLVSPESLESNISLTYLKELQNFASPDFWSDLVKDKLNTTALSGEQNVLLAHIRKGVEKRDEDQETSE